MNNKAKEFNANRKIWNENWKEIADYSTNSAGNLWAFYLIRKVLRGITISNDGCIIDVGCGMGNKSAVLAKEYPNNKVYGIDFAKEGINFAKSYYGKISNVEFHCGDARELDLNENIELITAFELIEHIEDWKRLLADFCRLTNKYILISTPTGRMRAYEKDIGHYRNFKKGEIEMFMEEQGFQIVKTLYAGFPFWSPITRDITNIRSRWMSPDDSLSKEIVVTYNPIIHKITYFLYKYMSFDSIGDQFMGLFKKN